MGGSGRSAIVLSGSLAMIGSVLPRWQCNIERISPERTEGYCHSGSAISRGCCRNVRGSSSLGELISNKAKKKRASRTSRALTREFLTRNNNLKIKIAHKINFVFSSPVHQGAVTSL